MKERIVIPKDKIKVLTSCDHFPANGYFTFYKEDVEVEQVPETYEELKELVNKYSGKINRQVCGITVGTTRIIIMMKFDNIYFGKNGNIYFADKFLGTYTSARQWQIIKSLIGEE